MTGRTFPERPPTLPETTDAALAGMLESKVVATAEDATFTLVHANDGALPGVQWALAWSPAGCPSEDWHADTVFGHAADPTPLVRVAVSSMRAAFGSPGEGLSEPPAVALALVRVGPRGRVLCTYHLPSRWHAYREAWLRVCDRAGEGASARAVLNALA